MLKLEPSSFFDRFIIGMTYGIKIEQPTLVYDQDGIIQALMDSFIEDSPSLSPEDARIEAIEYFEYNISGTIVSGYPIFVSKEDYESFLEMN